LKQLAYSLHDGGDPASGDPPLLLIHGAGGSRLSWPPNIRRLEGHKVYAVDLPGHAGSTSAGNGSVEDHLESLIEWQEDLGEDTFVWVGHSLGGAIALQAAVRHSQVVSGLILVGTGAHLPVNPRVLDLASKPERFRELVNQIISWGFSPETSLGLVELSRQRMSETSHEILHQDFLASAAFDLRSQIQDIRRPTLVLCGLEDKLTSEALSRELATAIDGAKLEFVPDAGHMVMLEKPEEVAQAMKRFLASIDS
jgi:pimeloyl-ACP methyl ester carboxylesterase